MCAPRSKSNHRCKRPIRCRSWTAHMHIALNCSLKWQACRCHLPHFPVVAFSPHTATSSVSQYAPTARRGTFQKASNGKSLFTMNN